MQNHTSRTAGKFHVRSSRALRLAIATTLLVAILIGMKLIDGSRSGTSKPVRVAVVDGGIDASHPALKATDVEVYSTPGVDLGASEHGTAVATIIVEQAQAGTVLGPPEIELLDVRALNSQGKGDIDDLAAGIKTAANHRADLIVASLSAEIGSPNLQAATEEA